MTNVARLSKTGILYAYEFDDNTNSSFSVSKESTAFSNEFDENTSTTLSADQRMSATSSGGVIVLDSINEIDPYGEIPTDGLQLHLDSEDSNINTEGSPTGQQVFTTSGAFTVPTGVTQVSAVVVGGGGGGAGSDGDRNEGNTGGGGGGLAYGTFSVTPGESLTVTVGAGGAGGGTGGNGGVGGTTIIARGATTLLSGGGGLGGQERSTAARAGGSSGGTERDGGGSGGSSGSATDNNSGSGGGGAGGYSGNGGNGGSNGGSGSAGSGGGGAGGLSTSNAIATGGGGVGLLGEGSSGTTSSAGGSGGSNGGVLGGGVYGGGGGARDDDSAGIGFAGGAGAARIIWGTGRSYPSTLTTDQTASTPTFIWEDISGNNRDAVFNGTTDPNSPEEGNFIDFDSTNDEYAVTDGSTTGSSAYAGVTGTSARSVVVGFQLDGLGINQRLFSYGNINSGNRFTFRITTTNFFRVELGNGYTQTTSTVGLGKYVIVVTVPASPTIGDIRIWSNGVEQTLSSFNPTNTFDTASNNNVSIGAAQHETTAPAHTSGQFSKVMIYNRELSESEIKLIYQSFYRRLV